MANSDKITLLTQVDKNELNFKYYYKNALLEQGEKVSEKIEEDICYLKSRLSSFLTLDMLKNIETIYAARRGEVKMMNGLDAILVISAYVMPLLPRKDRISSIKEPILRQDALWRDMDKNDVSSFLEEVIALSLNYSLFWDENKPTSVNVAEAGIKQLFKPVIKVAKKAVPVDIISLKWLLSALYQSMGIYIINHEFLCRSQLSSVKEAKDMYKKVLALKAQNAAEFLLINM